MIESIIGSGVGIMFEVIIGFFIAMGTAIALLLKSRSNQKERADKAEYELKQTEEIVKNVETKNEIKRDVVNSNESINDRLLNKYSRD